MIVHVLWISSSNWGVRFFSLRQPVDTRGMTARGLYILQIHSHRTEWYWVGSCTHGGWFGKDVNFLLQLPTKLPVPLRLGVWFRWKLRQCWSWRLPLGDLEKKHRSWWQSSAGQLTKRATSCAAWGQWPSEVVYTRKSLGLTMVGQKLYQVGVLSQHSGV